MADADLDRILVELRRSREELDRVRLTFAKETGGTPPQAAEPPPAPEDNRAKTDRPA